MWTNLGTGRNWRLSVNSRWNHRVLACALTLLSIATRAEEVLPNTNIEIAASLIDKDLHASAGVSDLHLYCKDGNCSLISDNIWFVRRLAPARGGIHSREHVCK